MIYKLKVKQAGRVIVLSILISVGFLNAVTFAKEVSFTPHYTNSAGFTQEDRERIIKVEEGQKSLQRQIDDLKTSTQRQFDNLYTLILWGFGILFGGMGILIGFVIWDRRTALAPAIRKSKELEEREEKIERVLKEMATKDPDVAEALKRVGLF